MNLRRQSVSRLLVPFLVAAGTATGASGAGDAFAVTIRIDAARTWGELKPIWRFFGADEPNYATMKDGRKLLAELGQLGPPGVLPGPQPAHERGREARAQVGQHQRLHRGLPLSSRL